ncbi:MAG: small, acid-soluble spore protein, alpha/beta type [Minisyncoccia bacterium]
MSKKKKLYPKAEDELESLKQEVAEELRLDDNIEKKGWGNMTTREVGKIGENMVKKMIDYAERKMDEEDGEIENVKPHK